MSSQAIEARSLSSLTTLASNPPAYPRNPTHVRHEPLVLYIARVPGSRDVFLSPMKPREKVVTAEDIQSSLYFIHVEQPDDVHFIEPFAEPTHSQETKERTPILPVQRKAVPATLSPPSQGPPRRKPVASLLAPTNDFANRQNIPAADQPQRRSFDSSQYREENRPPLPSRKPSERSYPSATVLTLIRRDPASGAQWNVARIEDPNVAEVSSAMLNEAVLKKKIGCPMYMEVTNPGYSKFLHTESEPVSTLAHRTKNLSINPQNLSVNPSSSELQVPIETPQRVEGNTFRRRLWMEGARYANGGFGHRKINSHDSSAGRQSPRNSVEWQRERSSMDLRSSQAPPFATREDQAYSRNQSPEKQSSFRGYIFMSPWNGRCEFITGSGGGSLKCRHVIPGLQGAPPVAQPVSELRFNLPSSSKASTPMADDGSKRSSFFGRPRNSRNNSSVSEMDLSLGQEFAGGGFGGKQAKLGKLIIEDEGLKMMDLLVAANVGLWWRAYEKVDGRARGDRGSF